MMHHATHRRLIEVFDLLMAGLFPLEVAFVLDLNPRQLRRFVSRHSPDKRSGLALLFAFRTLQEDRIIAEAKGRMLMALE